MFQLKIILKIAFKKSLLVFNLLLFTFSISVKSQTVKITEDFNVSETDIGNSAFCIVTETKSNASIRYDKNDFPGVIRAVNDLKNDIHSVTDKELSLLTTEPHSDNEIIIGTYGKSKLIDKLVSTGKLDVKNLKGKWENFVIATVENPLPGVKKGLVIAGSDKRGTIYGIYELSKKAGVSPWYWWADVPPKKHKSLYVNQGIYISGEPKVKYRGIFINDEAPCFTGWTREKFGGCNSKAYSKIFELLLRLRANYFWPAMWGNAFNEDDPDNARIADEYGIVMGTSHHEPMLRSANEWQRHKKEFGDGKWNYVTNAGGIQDFWRQGLERNKTFESILTMGMRGESDEPMPDAGSAKDNFRLLENIMKDQRKIIEGVYKKPASKVPQIWALYSEVLEYYDQGIKVPEDMIILLCDDNWGNVRRLPELEGKRHPGGYGIYYHVDLHGAPRAYQWLNMTQIPHMWEQLQLTYSHGVDKVWILNVGDLKPNEYPMDFFLNMAWDPETFNQNNLDEYAVDFCKDKFGETEAAEAAEILTTSCKYNARVTAEMLDSRTYNLENGEFLHVRDAYMALEARVLRQYEKLDVSMKDSYKQLILHPVRAMSNLYDMYYSLAMNTKLASEKDIKANYWADRVEYCFKLDTEYSKDYNLVMSGGKWNHLMDQTHIGYRSWNEPRGGNIMPAVVRIKPEETKNGGYIFNEKNGVVVIESEHYFETINNGKAKWTVIPDLGRTTSGITLLPYTASPEGSEVAYKMKMNLLADSVRVYFFFDCTLPYKNGAHSVSAFFNKGNSKTWKINDQLTWKNNYSKMYPAGAARMIETSVYLKVSKSPDDTYNLTISPQDPGIVLYKIAVDLGGYEKTFLKMQESPYKRN